MYTYFDAHCDTMSKMYKERIGLDSRELMVNTNNLHPYKSAIQVFALFNNGEMNKWSIWGRGIFYYKYLECFYLKWYNFLRGDIYESFS